MTQISTFIALYLDLLYLESTIDELLINYEMLKLPFCKQWQTDSTEIQMHVQRTTTQF